MSDSISAMYDDNDHYSSLCEKYGEKEIGFYGNWYDHYYELRDRAYAENKK